MIVAAGIILLLVAFNALYVAGEFGAVGARRSRLRRMAEDGHAIAARLLPVVDNPQLLTRYIAASQVGITLSGMALGAYADAVLTPRFAPVLSRWVGTPADTAVSIADGIILVGLTLVSVVFGELVPKSLALQFPTQAGIVTALPMLWSGRLYAWLIAIVDRSAAALRALLRMPSMTHRHVHSPEEIALLIAESRDGGLLEPQEQVRLHRALRLGLRNAGQLMVPRDRLAAIEASTPMRDVLRIAASSPFSRLPVYQGSLDTIVGILRTKDVVLHFLQRGRTGTLLSLVRPILRVPGTMAADRLLAFLRERRSHQALVVDEGGGVAGLITLEDVLGELLGNVPDEFKAQRLVPIRLTDGRVRLPGALPLERARIWVEGAWPHGYQTVADLIVSELERLPEPGEEIEVLDVPVTIESVENGAVASAIVTPPHVEEEDEDEERQP